MKKFASALEVVEQREVLVQRLDAGGARVGRRAQVDRLAVDADLAGVERDARR